MSLTETRLQEKKQKPLSDWDRKAMRDYVRAFERAPYKWYTPNGACEDITRAIGKSPETGKRIFAFLAANGVGKTTWLINLLANLIFEEPDDKWFNYPLFKRKWKLPKKIWVITEDSTLNEVWDSAEGGIHFWWPAGRYAVSKGDKGRIYHIKTDTGWEIYFKTVDQDPRKFESTTLGMVIIDEPISYKIYKGAVARLRAGGLVVFAGTPLEFGDWMIDLWLDNEDMQKYLYVQYASVYENMRGGKWIDPETKEERRARRGRLSKEDIEFMISQYDETEIEARVWGKFKALKGRVLKSFKPEFPYVIEPFDVSNPNEYQIYNVIDPHDRRYPAIGWYAVDKTNHYYVIHEWPNLDDFDGKYFYQLTSSDMSIQDIANKIKEIEEEHGWHVLWRWMDPNFGAKRYGNTGYTVQEEYEAFDLFFDTEVTDDRNLGHSKLRKLLKLNSFGIPGIQIMSHCRNHILSFHRYRYDEYKNNEKKLQNENVIEKFKDFVDTARYFAVNEPIFNWHETPVTGWRAKLASGGRHRSRLFMGA